MRHCEYLERRFGAQGVSVEIGVDHKLKRMLELANNLNARYALIVGDNEIVSRSIL